MTNQERQKKLDEAKWVESEQRGFDMGGCLPYCEYCERTDHTHPTEYGQCYATQAERESQLLCAKAYNRMETARVYDTREKTCPICGKRFIPAALHSYKVKNRLVCSYGCVCKYEKAQAEEKARAEERALAKAKAREKEKNRAKNEKARAKKKK